MASEEPQYRVTGNNEHFELREYAPYLVAETRVAAPFDQAGNEAFSILAGYIFGNNRGQQKIEMTAPVSQVPAGEKIEMTAPVAQTPDRGEEEAYVFSFVMPARYTRATLPVPLDARVKIREMPARTMAAIAYSGTWSRSRYEVQEKTLLTAVRDAGLKTVGQPVFARYNPPFMPWFLRRNEVMIEVLP
jgi:hypothetical protein